MAIILDGKKLSERILEELKRDILRRPGLRKKLKMAVVLVGEEPNSLIFLRQKEKACKKIGVDFQLFKFSENIGQSELAQKVEEISKEENNGIIVQLPLPKHIDTEKILSLIPAKKDVDRRPISPVLAGILALMREYKISFQDKKVAVAGRGRLVGQPVMKWLKKQGIEVVDDTRKADIVISGVGKPGFVIKGDTIKKSAVVIDAAGDVDFQSVFPKASYVTPTPGGLGPMTVAMVLKNLILLFQKRF